MIDNADECHLITSCNNEMIICVENYNITNNKCEKPSGIKIIHIDKL